MISPLAALRWNLNLPDLSLLISNLAAIAVHPVRFPTSENATPRWLLEKGAYHGDAAVLSAADTRLGSTRVGVRSARGAHPAGRSICAVLGGRPSSARTMWRIATRGPSSLSILSMSRMRGA